MLAAFVVEEVSNGFESVLEDGVSVVQPPILPPILKAIVETMTIENQRPIPGMGFNPRGLFATVAAKPGVLPGEAGFIPGLASSGLASSARCGI